jgi:hypothetical protein
MSDYYSQWQTYLATIHLFKRTNCLLERKHQSTLFFFHMIVIQKPHLYDYFIFQAHLFKAPNVIVECSKSGKLTNRLVEYWRDLLISDRWTGQGKNTCVYNNIRDLC